MNKRANKASTKAQCTSDPMRKRLFTIAEAGEYLALPVWTVRNLCWNRSLKVVRLGRRHLLDRQDLDALIDRTKDYLET